MNKKYSFPEMVVIHYLITTDILTISSVVPDDIADDEFNPKP